MLSHSIKRAADGSAILTDERLGVFFKSLAEETDRGIVIIVGTVVEERLALLLGEVLIPQPESRSFIHRSLSGLEARAKAAYCIGVISRREYEIVQFIRRVRNDFAHQFLSKGFDGTLDTKKAVLFGALATFLPGYEPKEIGTPRKAFETLAVHIITAIWDREHEFEDSDYIYERE
jgi:hypothetical protein